MGVIGPFLYVKENEDGMSHGTVHIKPATDSDKDYIVQNEQSIEFSEETGVNGIGTSEVWLADTCHSVITSCEGLQRV